MQRRFATGCDRYLSFKKEIELAGEWRFGATGAFGHGLNAAQRLRAPGNNQAGIAKLAFAEKDRGRALHATNLACDRGSEICRAQWPSAPINMFTLNKT